MIRKGKSATDGIALNGISEDFFVFYVDIQTFYAWKQTQEKKKIMGRTGEEER